MKHPQIYFFADVLNALFITLYITLVLGVAGTSFLQGFRDRVRSVRLPYRVPARICSFDIRLHIFFLDRLIAFMLSWLWGKELENNNEIYN